MSEGKIERKVGVSSGVADKVSKLDMSAGHLVMGTDAVKLAVAEAEAEAEAAARFSAQF